MKSTVYIRYARRIDQHELCRVAGAVGHVRKDQMARQTRAFIQRPRRRDKVIRTFVDEDPRRRRGNARHREGIEPQYSPKRRLYRFHSRNLR